MNKLLLPILLLPLSAQAGDPMIGSYRLECASPADLRKYPSNVVTRIIYMPEINKRLADNWFKGYAMTGFSTGEKFKETTFLKAGNMTCTEYNATVNIYEGIEDWPVMCFRSNLPYNKKIKNAGILVHDTPGAAIATYLCDVTKKALSE